MTYRPLFEQRRFRLRVKIHSHLVSLLIDDGKLIAGILLEQIVLQSTLFLKGLWLRVLPFGQYVVVLFKVRQQVDREGVVLVELVTIGPFQDFQGFIGIRVLNENIPKM